VPVLFWVAVVVAFVGDQQFAAQPQPGTGEAPRRGRLGDDQIAAGGRVDDLGPGVVFGRLVP
jgi:hypothetical protein